MPEELFRRDVACYVLLATDAVGFLNAFTIRPAETLPTTFLRQQTFSPRAILIRFLGAQARNPALLPEIQTVQYERTDYGLSRSRFCPQ